MRGIFDRLFRRGRNPELRSPEEALTHHVEVLAYHDTGDSNFSDSCRKFAELHAELVPDQGQADTIQGEIARAVNRLAGEDRRNGCMNWASGYQQFVIFLRSNMVDRECFSDVEIEQLTNDLNFVELNGTVEQPTGDVAVAFGRLIESAVNFCARRSVPLENPKDPSMTM